MNDSSTLTTEKRLEFLWNQGSQDLARLFLKKAIKPDMTLQELMTALMFKNIEQHLGAMSLRDVLQAQPSTAPQASSQPSGHFSPANNAPVRSAAPKIQRRKRRGPEQTEAIRQEVLNRLQAAVGSVNTSHLCMMLQKGGHDVDLLALNRLLNQLETEGYVLNLGGKPRAWRLKPQGRRAPEPIIIRKAQVEPGIAAS